MRGASVNFQKIHSAMHAVAHASRRVPPQYLLPPEHSLGTHVVIDDKGEVQKKLTEKMALASRQAKASKDYSPLWEGVINLPHPSKSVTAEHQIQIVKAWCEQYEIITGHKVLRADVHLDEGFLDASGKPQFNAHAHVMCDRTDEKGKVIKLSPKQLRELQGMTAEVTQLQRGKDARKTGRQHLNHVQYRFAAEQGRQQLEQTKAGYEQLFDTQLGVLKEQREKVKSLGQELGENRAEAMILKGLLLEEKALVRDLKKERDDLKAQLAALTLQYNQDREALKKSNVATQADYQALKRGYEDQKGQLAQAKKDLEQALKETRQAKAEASNAQEEAKQAKAQLEAAKTALTLAKAEAEQEAAAAQEKLQKAVEIANKNRDIALSYKAKLEVAQRQLTEASEVKSELAQAQKELRRMGQTLMQEVSEKVALQRQLKSVKTRVEASQTPKAPTPQPTPEKTLGERISASFEAMLEWVKQQGGKLRELDKANGLAIGPIEHIDAHHCVQSQGRGDYCIHRLDELDRVPRTDVTYEEIHYHDGRGHVKPQREQGMDFGR